MSIEKIDMSGFGELIKPILTSNELVALPYKEGSDMNRMVEYIATKVTLLFPEYTIDKDSITKEEFVDVMIAILSDLDKMPDMETVNHELELMANHVYMDTQSKYHVLKHDIANTVENLVNSIMRERDSIIRSEGGVLLEDDTVEDIPNVKDQQVPPRDPSDTVDPNATDPLPETEGQQVPPRGNEDVPSVEIPTESSGAHPPREDAIYQWDMFKDVGDIDWLCTEVGAITGMDLSTPMYIGGGYAYKGITFDTTDIDISEDKLSDAVTKMMEVLGLNDKEEVTKITYILFNSNAYKSFYHSANRFYNHGKPSEQVGFSDILLKKYLPIFRQANRIEWDFTDEQSKVLRHNIEHATRICLIAGYQAHYHRVVTFKDALILDNEYINADTYPKYLVDGGDTTTIHNLQRMLAIKQLEIPNSGFSTSYVLNNKEYLASVVDEYDTNLKANKKVFFNNATTRAFKSVLSEYSKNNLTNHPTVYDPHNSAMRSSVLLDGLVNKLHDEDSTLENATYEYILQMYYSNTAMKELYEKFDKSLVTALESTNTITEKDSVRINMNIATEMMIDNLIATY